MHSKWFIDLDGFELYRFGVDGNLYKLPFNSGLNYYETRLIKQQYNNRWHINGKLWSEKQLRPHIKLDPNPIELIIEEPICPF